MEYQFETLGDDRFQEFCQSLLIEEFPDLQCFPIGQPDGGRDAVVRRSNRNKSFFVFQVKFVKNPLRMENPHKWLIEILEKEAPKLRKLIPKGAQKYYLITNIPGTSHLEAGAIDKVQEILSKYIDIPTLCLWRDDLSRRLDNNWDLKWIYPELMTGKDALRMIFEQGFGCNNDRRAVAIKAFLTAQYQMDKDVRFKQIDLQNDLFDLFVDVPIEVDGCSSGRDLACLLSENKQVVLGEEYTGAAELLLHSQSVHFLPQIVLEGAPGQGKSTLTQFICQVYRMKILGISDENRIQKWHQPLSLKIPFRVDLRDLAKWLNKQDPFNHDKKNELVEGDKSLEAFLAAQVKFYSGGVDFTVVDLHAVAKISSLLIVLDGLDEVAEISVRKELIDEVKLGVSRLKSSAASVQMIITTRPNVFANSPGFPESTFPCLRLSSLVKPLIREYTQRWLKVKKVDLKEAGIIKSVINEKMELPHLRDLARNPMQLSILLNLVYTRGSSLPDKRTSLYESYVDLFFDRESEKSNIVRLHRGVLIDIHRFLAWKLHSEAEKKGRDGRITNEDLEMFVTNYLAEEGRDISLAQKLFTGVVERVVFLVSRVQGTFEFEVQPLREFFAASFLYDNASYSPAGEETSGTIIEIFEVMARNFYWLNVTRFLRVSLAEENCQHWLVVLKNLTMKVTIRN